jgi:hypothetical protein
MTILAIDPGTTESAYLLLVDGKISEFAKVPNTEMLNVIGRIQYHHEHSVCVIEEVRSYGMVVGAEVFRTVFWTGMFAHAWGEVDLRFLGRKQAVIHVCGSPGAKDANVRQAMLDRWGPAKIELETIGEDRKGKPVVKKVKIDGPTAGISKDVWAALAVASTAYDYLSKGWMWPNLDIEGINRNE